MYFVQLASNRLECCVVVVIVCAILLQHECRQSFCFLFSFQFKYTYIHRCIEWSYKCMLFAACSWWCRTGMLWSKNNATIIIMVINRDIDWRLRNRGILFIIIFFFVQHISSLVNSVIIFKCNMLFLLSKRERRKFSQKGAILDLLRDRQKQANLKTFLVFS